MDTHAGTQKEQIVNFVKVASGFLRAAWHLFRDRPARAEHLLREAALLAERSFRVHVAWGCALVRLGRLDEARAVLSRARELSPARFLREDLPLRLREDLAVGHALAGVDAPRLRGKHVRPKDPAPARSDFSDGSEWRRLRGLPAISRQDLDRVDLDDLLGRLSPPEVPGHRGDS